MSDPAANHEIPGVEPGLAAAIAAADDERRDVRDALRPMRAELPLRYWRQQAHLTTPASDAVMARKAVEGGTSGMPRMLERLGLRASDLAERLELPDELIEARLARPARAPLVMLDGEDAIALRDDVAARGLAVAADILVEADWGGPAGSLRFFRPPGLNLESTVRDLYTLLWQLRARTRGSELPLDGIVFPKVEHPEEVDLVNRLLDRAEADLELPPGQIRVAYLIESGWAASQLPEIARAAAPRLAGLIFGIADFSADLGLPAIATGHPLAEWARAEIVAVAGAVGVPAVDAMTLDYPVADPALDAAANRARWLDRMRLVYDDAVMARELGMLGKWVGHPAQLFAVLLAYEAGLADEVLDQEAAKLEAYETALRADQGATMIGGVMSDRATDRHARVVLRQATALGRFDPARAISLGVIDETERPEAEQAFAAARPQAG
ncbi:MAG TPA: aldolase/citrate lyase family protein [Candidatus Eisenbacteria bacterium]|nr:aldolase/citrate lyase family protein [Candidatus Eisenbacteria bacterium]